MGTSPHTQYNSSSSIPRQLKLIRPHHPLEGQLLEVIRVGPSNVAVRLKDGTAMQLPRSWTDIDGGVSLGPERICTIESLREVLELLETFRRKA